MRERMRMSERMRNQEACTLNFLTLAFCGHILDFLYICRTSYTILLSIKSFANAQSTGLFAIVPTLDKNYNQIATIGSIIELNREGHHFSVSHTTVLDLSTVDWLSNYLKIILLYVCESL